MHLTETERLSRAIRCVRNFIRDKAELNRLLRGNQETSDEELRMAIIHALLDWNSTPPALGPVTLATHPAKHLLVQAAAIEAIRSAMLWHSREHMPSSDGGTSADDHAKFGEYSQWVELLKRDYEQKKADLKVAQNLTMALGGMGVPSEYSMYYVYGADLAW